ncbi:MAG: hypothetical protein GY729_12935 [Desulfobacteraceae bacterium]|nr:hypothetical protein [Desulfobacteraceae bacterium]
MTINIIQGNMIPVQVSSQPMSFTSEQKETVASILSNYDSTSLTQEDAKAINDAFRDAGFKRGHALKNAIEAAGFDGDQIRELDPPPPEKVEGVTPVGSEHDYFSLNKEVLESLQDILNNYDFSSMTSSQEDEMVQELEDKGLLFPGLVINTMV